MKTHHHYSKLEQDKHARKESQEREAYSVILGLIVSVAFAYIVAMTFTGGIY